MRACFVNRFPSLIVYCAAEKIIATFGEIPLTLAREFCGDGVGYTLGVCGPLTPSYLCDGEGCGGAVERPLPMGKGSAGTGMSVSCARSFDVVEATLMAS